MNNNDIKNSYLQAFFAKKDIFLQKLVLDCLFPENFLTLIYKKVKGYGRTIPHKTKPQGVTLMIKKLSIKDNDRKHCNLQAFFAKKDREDTK